MPTPEKATAVNEYKALFEQSDSFFVTDYQGLNVSDMTTLRENLRDNNVKYLVAKNTLLLRAMDEAGIEGISEFLKGPTAIAFGGEPATTAKILHESFKERKLPRMKVFVVDHQRFDASDIKRLADLPPKDQLLSMVAAAVEAPLTELVGSLDGFFRELVGSIDALAKQREVAG